MKRVYLDNSSTTWPKPDGVAQAAVEYLNDVGCNLNRGGYTDTCVLHAVAKDTRALLCELFNGPGKDNVVFALNVTAALNYVMKGLLKTGDHVLITSMEHNAVTRPLHQLKSRGVSFDCIPCDECGRLQLDAVEGMVRPSTRAIVSIHASNVCGTVMPIRALGEIAQERGLLFIVDAAQSAGVLPIDMEADHISILCWTGHKGLFGPPGIGGFVIPDELALQIEPVVAGGTGIDSSSDDMPTKLPMRFEAGTAPLMSMYGLRRALQFVKETGVEAIHAKEMLLWKRLVAGLNSIGGLKVVGTQNAEDSVAIASFYLENGKTGDLAYLLDHDYNIATRVGVHCAPYAARALGVFPDGVLRMSPGYFTTDEEIEYALDAVARVVEGLE